MPKVIFPIELNFIIELILLINLNYSKYLICIIRNKTQD